MGTAIFAPPATGRAAEASDDQLITDIRAGDDAAFAELYRRYQRRIAAYIFGMVKDYGRAEDISQDVFVSALRRIRATDRPIAFKPWIYEIAKNACIDQFRRSRRGEEVSYDAEDGLGAADHSRLVTTGLSPDSAVDQKQRLDHLCGAFSGLSQTHHEILVMRELEGLSYREIGERLGMTRPAVESTLFRARRRLAEEYEELVSGERCLRVQTIIAGASSGALGTRDRRRMAAHVSHCQPCRRHARMAGIDAALLDAPRPVRAKIAALVPLPAFLRRRWSDGDTPGHGGTLAQWSGPLSALSDPAAAGWAKAIVAAATIAIAGLGAGAATQHGVNLSGGDHGGTHGAPAAQAAASPAQAARRASGAAPTNPATGSATAAATGPIASRETTRRGTTGTTGTTGAGSTGNAGNTTDGSRKNAAGVKTATGTVNGLLGDSGAGTTPNVVPVHDPIVRRTVKKAIKKIAGDGGRALPAPTHPVADATRTAVKEAKQSVTQGVAGATQTTEQVIHDVSDIVHGG